MALQICFQSNYPALMFLEPFCIDAAEMDIITSYITIKNYLILSSFMNLLYKNNITLTIKLLGYTEYQHGILFSIWPC